MIQLAEKFPDEQILAALRRQLGWTHFTLLLPIKDSLCREFYAEMCRQNGAQAGEARSEIDGCARESPS